VIQTNFKSLAKFLWPFASALPPLAYMSGVQALYAFEIFNSLVWLAPLFFPAAVYELFITRHFFYKNQPAHAPVSRFWLHFIGNLFVWLAFYLACCVFVAWDLQRMPFMRLAGPGFYIGAITLWGLMGWLAWAALAYWLVLYTIVVIVFKRFRLVFGVMLFFVFTAGFFVFLWLWGGLGRALPAEITAQAGVSQVLDYREISGALREDRGRNIPFLDMDTPMMFPDAWIVVLRKPRDIWFEPEARTIYCAYGTSYHDPRKAAYPMLVSKNLDTGRIRYLLSNVPLYFMWGRGEWLLLSPWIDPYVYAVSKDDLSLKWAIPSMPEEGLHGAMWAPLSTMADVDGEHIHVFQHFFTLVQSYDIETGQLTARNRVAQDNPFAQGGGLLSPVQSPRTRNIYLSVLGARDTLLELDPDTLAVKRRLNVGSIGQMALVLDSQGRHIYGQSFTGDTIVRVNINDWKVERRYKGEALSRRLALDEKRNALYVLSFGRGRLFAVDLETGKRKWSLKVGGMPAGLDFKDDALWVNSMSGAFRVELEKVWEGVGR
jgi:hypothetical protein